jgi:DNA-binding response OmpR family regulator
MRSLNILVVEDDRDFANGLADYLRLNGHDVDLAGSGEAGLARLAGKDFDLALLDIMLPGMSGADTLRSIRVTSPETAVILMTGQRAEVHAAAARKLGAIDILQKPFDPSRIFDHVKKTNKESGQ